MKSRKCAIGIDLGGTNIKYALVDLQGKILWRKLRPTEADNSKEQLLINIKNCIQESLNYSKEANINISGIGIGVPGITNKGIVVGGADNLPDFVMVPLSDILENKFNLPVKLENDANLMALAESKTGSAAGASDVIFLTVGTGIGGGMLLNGKLYSGYDNRGAELGHIIVQKDGKKCSCGACGCLEAYASTSSLVEFYTNLLKQYKITRENHVDGKTIFNKFLNGDEIAIEAMNDHFDWLSVGIASFVNVFSPELVIIGGGISEAGDAYINPIRERVAITAMKDTQYNTRIKAAQLGNDAGILGAAALILEGCTLTG